MTFAPFLGAKDKSGQSIWLTSADQLRLRMVVWSLPDPRGTVLILPGRTEHAEKYASTAAYLRQNGYAAAAIDWRGQGHSDRLIPDRRRGHVGRFADYQLDLAAYFQAAKDAGLPGPYVMLAHSMGGCIGLRGLMNGLAFDAACFTAPMWGIHMRNGRGLYSKAAAAAASWIGLRKSYAPRPGSGPHCYLETATFEGNLLTSDAEEWGLMQEDLRRSPEVAIAGPTIGWVHEALRECAALSRLPSPAIPCLTGYGTEERIVSIAPIDARMAQWRGGKTLRIEGARHELLMETPALRRPFLGAMLSHFEDSLSLR